VVTESAGYRTAEGGFGDAESAGLRDTEPERRPRPTQDVPRAAVEQPAESAGYRTAAGGFSDAVEQRDPGPPPLAVQLSGAAAPDVRQRVMMLYRAGFSPSLIASRVGAPVGEVELIISLEQRKGQA
jgi:hypothetical protein